MASYPYGYTYLLFWINLNLNRLVFQNSSAIRSSVCGQETMNFIYHYIYYYLISICLHLILRIKNQTN